MDSLLSSLQTKQNELEGDESLLERDKLIAALKEEVATLKATLEEKDEVTSLSCSLTVHYLSTVLTTPILNHWYMCRSPDTHGTIFLSLSIWFTRFHLHYQTPHPCSRPHL